MLKISTTAAALAATAMTAAPAAYAGPDEYLGEIVTMASTYCPRGTLEADGRILAISENSALFSLLGTTYGGDGRSTFALPDLRGRTMIGAGDGPGLTPRRQGARGGAEALKTESKLAGEGAGLRNEVPEGASTMPPYLAVKHCVVAQGIFPSRN
ncbi:phage tail protein [Henriciella marina]|uniref:phage tail protein n=1 Tax=Henriciella marina TaxID=453851 RepID=UPI0003772108|nr:tail fiber protein [Henriciella marina]